MFRRFVYGRISVSAAITRQMDQMGRSLTLDKEDEDEEEEAQAKPTPPGVNGDHTDQVNDQPSTQTKKESDMEVLEKSGSQRAIENLLKVYYEPLELWFLRSSIEKVGRTAQIPQPPQPPQPPHHLILGCWTLWLIVSGSTARLARTVCPPTPLLRTRRHLLPPQARDPACPLLRLAPDSPLDAPADIRRRRPRLHAGDQAQDGCGVRWARSRGSGEG